MVDQETIVALCTPIGKGAVALIRVSGHAAFAVVARCARLTGNKSLNDAISHTIEYGTIVDRTGNVLDEVLFLLMRAPRTFTGEDVVEITCHNNMYIIESIIAQLIDSGARMAKAGEFTERAVLHKKIDLLKAEAIHDLIVASNQSATREALGRLRGSLSHEITHIEEQLVGINVLVHASFEFLDDDAVTFDAPIREQMNTCLGSIERIVQTYALQKQVKEGIRIALLGGVNAGKSSLFNALIKTNRAIVSPLAGTTRDSIEYNVYEQGLHWTVIDTAGLRLTEDSIEAEGITRSLEQAALADIILFMVDLSVPMNKELYSAYMQLSEKYATKMLVIGTKADTVSVDTHVVDSIKPLCTVSVFDAVSIDNLKNILLQRIALLVNTVDTPYVINERHMHALTRVQQAIILARQELATQAYELVALHIKDALEELGSLTGASVDAKVFDAVFKHFCVGK